IVMPNLASQGTGQGAQGAALAAAIAGARGGSSAIDQGAKAVIRFIPPPPAPTAAEQALAQAQKALADATAAVNQAQQGLRGGRGGAGGGQRGGRGAAAAPPDFTTVQRVDSAVPPQFTGDETLFEALFADSSTTFADIKAKAQKGEPLSPMSLPAKVTVNI